MATDPRAGCCADWPKPCSYHEGWADCRDTTSDAAEIDRLCDLRDEVDQLRAALQRVMRESDLPAYYGPGSWWNEALDALNDAPLERVGRYRLLRDEVAAAIAGPLSEATREEP